MKKDELGTRMKEFYEERFKAKLLRRGYTIIRVDGKAFHTYTKELKRPFDEDLMNDMDETAVELCKNIQGAKFAFVQSDEISILLTDFDELTTQAWFDNEVQKIVSISASLATAYFNEARRPREAHRKLAMFDSRVFQLPTKSEVANYFIWRQQDTVRNSISSVAQSLYSPKQLHGKNGSELQEMIFQKGINWNDYVAKYKRGRVITKVGIADPIVTDVVRYKWSMIEPPIFTQEREFLNQLIPSND